MKKILFFLIILSNLNSQNLSELTEQNLFRGGNVFLLDKLNKYDLDIEGSPYLNLDFEKGQIIFQNGNSYSGDIRIDLVAQNFEIRRKDGKITPISVDDKVKININGENYKMHVFNTSEYGNMGILRECIKLDNISLYYFPRKKLQKPIEAGISAPTSGYGKKANPEWKDNGFYFFLIGNKYIRVPTKHKKISELKIFNDQEYKLFRKRNKLDLKNERKLVELVKYFNDVVK